MAARPIAWAAAAALVGVAPASAVLTSRGSLVLRDIDASQTSKDLTWLGSVAAILAVLSWIPRAAGLRDCLGRGRAWTETAVLVVIAGALGGGLSQASTLVAPGTATAHRLSEHAAIVLQVGGLAMLAASLPLVRHAPIWAVLGALVCAEALPGGPVGRALATATAGDPSDASTWLVVAGLWIASLPRVSDACTQTTTADSPAQSG
jgi:hypothetical protein